MEGLANSALSAGFVETEVFSGSISTSWTDLDLSSVVGANQSLVLIKYEANTDTQTFFREDGSNDDFDTIDGGSSTEHFFNSLGFVFTTEDFPVSYNMILTASTGIVEMKARYNIIPNATISVVFYLNQ